MTLTYVASLPLPAVVPSVNLSIGVPAIAINASFSGNLALSASLASSPPTIASSLAALATAEANMTAAIGLGLPSVSFGISDILSFNVQLEAAFGLLVTLEGLLSAAIGMYAFTYSGVASSMGAALTTELATVWPDGAPSSGSCNAMIFGAVSAPAQTQIASFLNGLAVGAGLVYTAKMSALAQLSVVTNAAIGEGYTAIQSQLDVMASLAANVSLTPPTLAASLTATAQFAAYLSAHASLGPPSVQAAISATANLAASLSAQFGLVIELGAALSSPGLFFCYTYSGTGTGLGAAVTTALASTWGDGVTSTSGVCLAPILATTDSFTWTTMLGFFGGL
jgi:hypothetical protein